MEKAAIKSHGRAYIREAYRVFREMLPPGGVLTVEGDQLIVVLMLGGECHGRRIELWGPDIPHPMGVGLQSEVAKAIDFATSPYYD